MHAPASSNEIATCSILKMECRTVVSYNGLSADASKRKGSFLFMKLNGHPNT
jgi:hypothetical protein